MDTYTATETAYKNGYQKGFEDCFKKYSYHNLLKNRNDLPESDGWYYCWIKNNNINYGMDLYFYKDSGKFIDNRRKNVFELYDVMAYYPNRSETFWPEKVKILTDDCVDRTSDVVAWKHIESFTNDGGKRIND